MGRWKKDETEFTINLNHDERRGCIAIIPKPIIEKLNNPSKMKFNLIKNGIVVSSGD